MIAFGPRPSSGSEAAGLARRLRQVALLAAVVAGSLGLFVLVVGWFFDVSFALHVISGGVAMKANTALGIALAGLALGAGECSASVILRRVAYACCVAVVLIGASALIENTSRSTSASTSLWCPTRCTAAS